jgi:response regulator NasT
MRSRPPLPPELRVVVATVSEQNDAAQASRADVLRIGLLEAGYDLVASLSAGLVLPERITQLRPDLVVIDAESDARGALDLIVIAGGDQPRPIVVFTEDPSTASMDAAMAAGVSAYVVAGLQAGRIEPVLNVALARFRQEQKLHGELADTRRKLAERKIVERAKGVLMLHQDLSEEQAYQKLRSMAMNKKLKMAEIAQRVLDVSDLLG